MKNVKSIGLFFIALGIGLAAGYFLFGRNSHPTRTHPAVEVSEVSNASSETWICSMHPQIRQNESGLCPICEMDLTPAESNTSSDPLVLQMTEEAVKLSNIETTKIGNSAKATEKTIQLTGKVQADERLASSQVAHVPGRIEKLYVTFTGEPVQKGQKLADIYAPELITAQRELLEAVKLQVVNPSLLEAARNKLKFWKISDATIQAIETSETIQETFTLYADESGIVTKRRVAIGDHLEQGEPLFDLMNLRKVWVLFDVYEENLAHINVGDRIDFSVTAIPNRTFQARVTFIDPILNATTRTVPIRTEVTNTNGLLKPELFVQGTLQHKIRSSKNVTVPKSAVLWTGKRSVVYIKIPDMDIPSFKFREIELGDAIGNSYQVVSGLEAGEEVVTYGSFTIDAAAQLNNQASMMNKNVHLKKEAVGAIPDFQAATPLEFKQQMNTLANQYIHLKDALVATDAVAAASTAEQFVTQLEKINGNLLEGDALVYWMEQFSGLKAHSLKITQLNDVEAQRKQFGFLSDVLITSIEAFGTDGAALYVQYCPMAFNNQGGDWLALEEQIQNPYFGDKMMKCGLVKKEF